MITSIHPAKPLPMQVWRDNPPHIICDTPNPYRFR